MGGKSKPTIGYWYKMLLHFGWSRGPLDALHEMRGGDRTAWAGRAESGTISVDARELWGGEKAEGGIEGNLDVMLGEAEQEPNARLASHLGDQQSAYRGRASAVFEGLYGAFNPYPKGASFKVSRVFKGWDNDTCWYPEKVQIPIGDDVDTEASGSIPHSAEWAYQVEAPGSSADYSAADHDYSGWPVGPGGFGSDFYSSIVGTSVTPASGKAIWIRRTIPKGSKTEITIEVAADDGAWLWWNGVPKLVASLAGGTVVLSGADLLESNELAVKVMDSVPAGSPSGIYSGVNISWVGHYVNGAAMNPAHMLYDSLTADEMLGEPTDIVDEASFLAAADRLFDEAFGLCTTYDPASETVEGFQQRICNVIGGSLSQSRVDGRYHLTLIRGDHDLETLPILEDDDILEYQEEPSDPLESVNQLTIEWFDPITKQKRSTTPIQSLGAIQASGGIIAEVGRYPEIPYEALALRVGARDLSQKGLLKRFTLTTNRVPYAWRSGQFFRLQAPRRGIADMVCMVGEIDAGTPRSGAMRLVALQDVAKMPDTTYVSPEPGVDTSPSQTPGVPEAQQLIEAPYVDLVGDMSVAELDAQPIDIGYLLAMAKRPSSGINYTLFTAADGETLTDRGSGDWCPTALIVEAAGPDPAQTSFTLSGASDLDLVEVGSAALWGDEICRVDALDRGALTVTLARGCGDTVPQEHAAAERLWFYDAWSSSDRRDYAAGEEVLAKLRTRTSSQLLDAALAPTLTLTMGQRFARPYPPGRLRITDDFFSDVAYPSSAIGELAVTWVHRDRLLQADTLVEEGAASIGPEDGTTYTVRYYLDDALDDEEPGITGTASTPLILSGDGVVRVEVIAVRDGLDSWQAATAEFDYMTDPNDDRVVDSGDTRITDSGDRRILD